MLSLFVILSSVVVARAVSVPPPVCDRTAEQNEGYQSYFKGLEVAYGLDDKVYKCYKDCGWPLSANIRGNNVASRLPTLVVAVGLESAGQKIWTSAVFDALVAADPSICSTDPEATNPSNINGDKNFPLLTSEELAKSYEKEFSSKGSNCKVLIDFSHSFPVGKKKLIGRVMRHGDVVNLQQLHGVHYNVKYIVLLRNVVDTAMVSLSRQSVRTVDHSLRAVESSLVYLEAALANVPCHQKFLAHFENFRKDPRSFAQPLKTFLGLESDVALSTLDNSLSSYAKNKKTMPVLKLPRDVITKLCTRRDSDKKCNYEVRQEYEKFFSLRSHMWPTFAGLISS